MLTDKQFLVKLAKEYNEQKKRKVRVMHFTVNQLDRMERIQGKTELHRRFWKRVKPELKMRYPVTDHIMKKELDKALRAYAKEAKRRRMKK